MRAEIITSKTAGVTRSIIMSILW